MGNGTRQCTECGWTCYGSRNEMKKHRRAKHRRAQEPGTGYAPILADAPDTIDPETAHLSAPARATQVDELSDEVLGYLDHLHEDLRAILAHLNLTRPECGEAAPDYEETKE